MQVRQDDADRYQGGFFRGNIAIILGKKLGADRDKVIDHPAETFHQRPQQRAIGEKQAFDTVVERGGKNETAALQLEYQAGEKCAIDMGVIMHDRITVGIAGKPGDDLALVGGGAFVIQIMHRRKMREHHGTVWLWRRRDRNFVRYVWLQSRKLFGETFDKNPFPGKLGPKIFENVQYARPLHGWLFPCGATGAFARAARDVSGARRGPGSDASSTLRRGLKPRLPEPISRARARTNS